MKNLKTLKDFSLNICLTVTTFLLLIPYTPSLAVPYKCIKCENFSGIFIGIAGGGVHGSAKYFRYRQGGDFGYITTQDSITDSGWIVGGQLQASQTYCKLYNFGLEVWANRSFIDLQTNDKVFFKESLSYKMKQSIGIAGRLGIVTGSVLFYIKPGIIFSKRDIYSQFLAILDENNAPIPSHSSKRYMPGFSFGVGSDVAIPHSRFTVGGEVTATQYRSFSYIHPMPSGIPGNIKTQFHPKTFTFLVKLNYKLYPFH